MALSRLIPQCSQHQGVKPYKYCLRIITVVNSSQLCHAQFYTHTHKNISRNIPSPKSNHYCDKFTLFLVVKKSYITITLKKIGMCVMNQKKCYDDLPLLPNPKNYYQGKKHPKMRRNFQMTQNIRARITLLLNLILNTQSRTPQFLFLLKFWNGL